MPTHRKTGDAILLSCHLKSEGFALLVAKLLVNTAAAPGVCCQGKVAEPNKQSGKCLTPGLPDVSALSLQLQQEWHLDNNALLGGIKVKPHSHARVMWSCPNCPAGCPHIWETSVASRTGGSKCPYCHGNRVCQHSSLATTAPRQTQFWNHDKNAKTPEQVLAGSNLRAEWKCPICSHEWQAQVAQRARNDSGCPLCSKATGRKTKKPTFEAAQHQLLLEWDHERNAADGIHADKPPLAATGLCIGCARSVQRDSCTGMKCVLMFALGDTLKGVHIVLASEHVSAILCKLVTLSFRQSGTALEMT